MTYLGSDNGYKMQAEALQRLANSTAEANETVTKTYQGALAGQVQNTQRMIELVQAKAQADVSAASKENKLKKIVDAGLEVYNDYQQKQQQAKVKQVQAQQEIETDKEYAQIRDKLADLQGEYETNNWRNGAEAFKYEASKLIATYQPKTKEQAAYLVKLVEQVNNAYNQRTAKVGDRLQEETMKQRLAKREVERNNLSLSLSPMFSSVRYNTDPAQRQSYLNGIWESLNKWKASAIEGGVPEADVHQILAEVTGDLTKRFLDGSDLSAEQTMKIQNSARGSQEWNELERAYGAGQISYEDKQARQAQLEVKYPGFVSSQMARIGDEEKFKFSLVQLNQQQQELTQKVANQAVAQVQFTDTEVTALAARLYLGGEAKITELLNTPGLKDNAFIQRGIALARRISDARKDERKVTLENQQAITAIGRLNITDANAFISLSQSLVKPQKEMTQADLINAQLMAQIQNISPEAAAAAAKVQQGQKLTAQDIQTLQAGLNLHNAKIKETQLSLQREMEIRYNGFLTDYQDLYTLGLLGTDAKLTEFAKQADPILQRKIQEINQLKVQTQQQVQTNYGVQPNFNESPAYAPMLDSKGNLLLAPRAQARRMKIDGREVVTPIIGTLNINNISSPYGWRQKTKSMHAGIDFPLAGGQKAVALVSGTVVNVGHYSGYGNTTDILGDNGVLYRYAHSTPFVKKGDRVQPGQPVVTPDGTGTNIGSRTHLHFETRKPQFRKGKYDVNLNFGFKNTMNPLDHLAKLQAGDSNALAPRGDFSAFAAHPTKRAPNNSTVLANGAVVNAGQYQRPSMKSSVPAQTRITNQRPARAGYVPGRVQVGTSSYNPKANLGYAILNRDVALRTQIHKTAQNLGIPAEWIADIIQQESSFDANKDHAASTGRRANPNQNHGLFGFGSDSGIGANNFIRLRSGRMSGAEQVQIYERYIKQNGWDRLVRQRKGNVTIADLWAISKMGSIMRANFLRTQNLRVRSFPGTKKTYADEIALLGKWVGRRYDLGGASSRRSRNAAVTTKVEAINPVSTSLYNNRTPVPTRVERHNKPLIRGASSQFVNQLPKMPTNRRK